ncbi:MAG: dUTP diphosphatase [Roseinatronobacter sp.]|jgi:dUTP pyrophosphatase|nr:dUTP diphosphatase [Roseinatronobacter sp.]
MSVTIRFLRLAGSDPAIPLPAYASAGAAGADIRANLPQTLRDTGIEIAPMARVIVPTGLACEIPQGFEMQIRARSGLALRHGIALPNAPATIDSDYRGEIGVILINLGEAPYLVEHGARIAQIVISAAPQARFELATQLQDSARGTGGYGSTGVA